MHGEAWLAPHRRSGEALENRPSHGQFRRGFIEVVWMPAYWFTRRAWVLFARMPVRELRVTRSTVLQFAEFLNSPFLDRLRCLDLSDRKIGDAWAGQLFLRPLPGLRELRLRACNMSNATIDDFLAHEPAAPRRVDLLDVGLNDISPDRIARLRTRFGDSVVRFDPPPPTDLAPAPPGR
jgi:hypothetical protein